VEIQFHSFLTSAIVGGELSDFCSGRFPPGNCLSVSLEFQGLFGLQSWSGSFVLEKNFLSVQEMKHAFVVFRPAVFSLNNVVRICNVHIYVHIIRN
jgi:hypothetical protein